ncbi:thioredoxin reductase [Hypnocyclicus thermotrophus]|uniref:Thioredoxin reductase n=1 Tax=Hypnocyclicus thermotrophus TaxID=1627895 RepID=A0AA46I4R6_9FUSO|nr:FAD-dependent oxidoreductase [Hypnocyclicus thermotrophus]TDT67011.1 thioredoxin reductase [Hypnocyclicus thermotrophus]
MKYDIVVIGGGPAGLAAAIEAYKVGIKNILIIERDKELGGILQQCIHNGFGLHEFREELTGPEYAQRFITQLKKIGIDYKLDSMVLTVTQEKKIQMINTEDGFVEIEAKSIVLAMGCRERTRGAISIPGDRPAGIFTAGTAQRFINMEGYMVGKKVVILGSGDIGLIMARRMTLEGAEVKAVVELLPYSGGLNRNIVQCLDDYDIPLLLSHTVTNIKGKDRVEEVTIAKVDENRKPIKGTEQTFEVDTLLLSVGLIPENELSLRAGIDLDQRTSGPIVNEAMETSVKGIFACGNVVHVHDLVDFVTAESRRAGKNSAKYVLGELDESENYMRIKAEKGIRYTVPQKVRVKNIDKFLEVFFRVTDVYRNVKISIDAEGENLFSIKKEHLAPGEMEKINIPLAMLEKYRDKDISISVVEGDK